MHAGPKSFFHYSSTFVAGLATMLGIISFFQPNVAVNPLAEIDQSRPLSMQFEITNNGFLTLNDLEYACGVEKIEGRVSFGSYGGPPGLNESSPRFTSPQQNLGKSLNPNHSDTVSCDFELFKKAEPIRYADIGIVVSFKISFVPWRRERVYHFITQKRSDGKLYWIKKPLDR